MFILIGFAFIAGLVTILSPCILPILPIVLSGSLSGGKWRPLGVVVGFILSFTFFATFSFTLAKALGLSTEVLRLISVGLLIAFGISMLIPQVQLYLEHFASRFSGVGGQRREGFLGGIVLGISLGFVWTPCVGPILASVLTLAATSQITSELILITLSFSLGTALPMLAIAYGGHAVIDRLPALKSRSEHIQKFFAVLIILTAGLIFFNLDRKFQTYILTKFPEYGIGLTTFEDNDVIDEQLDRLQNRESDEDGKLELNLDDVLNFGSQPAPNPDFDGATEWVNSEPLSLNEELKGKVVLVDFWTYTCINCIRTLPYVTTWYETYKDDGFVIVGVHTPEFEFEKNKDNVLEAMEEYGITYPVVQDNDYKIWRSYENRYWPAHYLIDKEGNVRYTHFGEGKYDETEAKIRKLLEEDGGTVTGEDVEMEDVTPQHPRSPESYLGYGRIERFASIEQIIQDQFSVYSLPPGLPEHFLAYGGSWNVGREYARAAEGSQLGIQFEGQEVFLVMRTIDGVDSAPVQVELNGELVTVESAGTDVQDGIVTVTSDRLYKLIKLESPGTGYLQLTFPEGNVEVYAFTFG